MEKQKKRRIELAVISDVHLGTYGCKAKELLRYLKTIRPDVLVLNGDIIDIWQFSKSYFPNSHLKVIKYILSLLSKGTRVYYIAGNHDEMLRKFVGFRLANFQVVNKLVLELDGKTAWFFHGDVFDVTMKHSKWLAKLGGKGYDLLILLNTLVNWVSERSTGQRFSFSKHVKQSVKSALRFIDDFESTALGIARNKHYDYVVCGHIHQPAIRCDAPAGMQPVSYLNSGDWVENMTALEYHQGQWSLYEYTKDPNAQTDNTEPDEATEKQLEQAEFADSRLFSELLSEFGAAGMLSVN